MLTIRDEQVRLLLQARKVEIALEHIVSCFPARKHLLDRLFVERALRRAESHGLNAWPEQLQFLACEVVFGPGFESKSGFGWAKRILQQEDPASRSLRAQRLHRRALIQLEYKEEF